MPKAAMHENNGIEFLKKNVRIPPDAVLMQTKSISKRMKARSHPPFGAGILPLDCRHVLAAPYLADGIHR